MYIDNYANHPFAGFMNPRPQQRQRRAPQASHDMFDSFFGLPQASFEQKPRRAHRAQPTQQAHPRSRNNTGRAKPQPPAARENHSTETQSQSAITIQKAFRAHQIKRQNLLPKLRALQETEGSLERANEKFHNVMSTLPQGEKLRMAHAELEEILMRALITLDALSTQGSQLVRDHRKAMVKSINEQLAAIDAKKPEIRASVALEAEAKRVKEQQQRLEEAAAESESDAEHSQQQTAYEELLRQQDALKEEEKVLEEQEAALERQRNTLAEKKAALLQSQLELQDEIDSMAGSLSDAEMASEDEMSVSSSENEYM